MSNLFNDHNGDRNCVLRLESLGPRGRIAPAAPITMAQLYDILHKRLEHARCSAKLPNGKRHYAPLDEMLDIDALCQNFCVEVEKALGIYPNVPKLTRADDDDKPLGAWTGGTTNA